MDSFLVRSHNTVHRTRVNEVMAQAAELFFFQTYFFKNTCSLAASRMRSQSADTLWIQVRDRSEKTQKYMFTRAVPVNDIPTVQNQTVQKIKS